MFPTFEYEYVSYEELYEAYLDCRKKKRTTINAMEFEIDETVKLYNLWIELNKQTYAIGKSIVFVVDKPVKREIFAADFRDRIIHHLFINRIMSYFEDEFIDDSYSCRVGKGTDYGIRKCQEYIIDASENYTKETYILKCDLKSFFMTIDKNRLYDKISRFITNKNIFSDHNDLTFMLSILYKIIYNEPQNNCIRKQSRSHWDDLPHNKSLFFCDKHKGLPIGNLTSQIFANFFLDDFDHYMISLVGEKRYGRYVDDFFVIMNNKEQLTKLIDKIRKRLAEDGVTLHPNKLYIQSVEKGVKFIGAVIKKDRIYISNRTKGNMWNALKHHYEYLMELKSEKLEPTPQDIEYFIGSMNSYLGFMVHYNSFNIRKKLILSDMMRPWMEYCYVDKDFKKLTSFKEYTIINGKKRLEKDKCDLDALALSYINSTKKKLNVV